MKRPSILSLLFAAMALVLVTSCDTTPPEPVGPTLSLGSGAGLVSDTATVFTDSTFQVQITATAGDARINRIAVSEDGTNIAADRVVLDGFTAGSNPSPVQPSAGFTWLVTITAGSTEGTSTYTITVTDSAGLTASQSVDITTEDFGTPVEEQMMVLLLNQAGPVGTGGLDLETGNSVGTTGQTNADTTADVRDMGIDTNLPNDQNWKQQIGTINDSDLRLPPAGFDYDAVLVKEEIVAAFNDGQSFTVSDKVEIGDVFLAKSRRGNYFVLKTVEITVTPSDNEDKYEFSVKK